MKDYKDCWLKALEELEDELHRPPTTDEVKARAMKIWEEGLD